MNSKSITTLDMKLNQKKQFAWALYDWGNSAFSTSIMAGFFPVFFKEYWSSGVDSALTTARLGTLIAFASVGVAILSPVLGALADLTESKKKFLLLFSLVGAGSALALSFIGEGHWYLAGGIYTLGIIGFFGSMTFYDGLLPSLAQGDEADRVSIWGYALGYLGGGVLLLVHILWLSFPETFGFSSQVEVVRWVFASVAAWWLIFTLPLLIWVPEPKKVKPAQQPDSKNLIRATVQNSVKSFKKIYQTLTHLPANKNLFYFLLAYWFYIDGIYTVMNMAVDYGLSLGLESQSLISALLLVQLIGFPATLGFIWISNKFGYKAPILGCLMAYSCVLVGAVNMSQAWHFFALAAIIGLIQGGVQALSRSLFANLIPQSEASEYFGLFNFVAKFAAIMGPILVGWGTYFSGSHRLGMGSLLLLFALGTFFLLKVKTPKCKVETKA